jgi:hypothetical protein
MPERTQGTLAAMARRRFTSANAVHAVVTATALAHGLSSDPDHEVGDLQGALRVAVGLLSKTQRVLFLQTLAETTFEGEGWGDVSFCRTEGCPDDPDDGEGWDGFCGHCADRRPR